MKSSMNAAILRVRTPAKAAAGRLAGRYVGRNGPSVETAHIAHLALLSAGIFKTPLAVRRTIAIGASHIWPRRRRATRSASSRVLRRIRVIVTIRRSIEDFFSTIRRPRRRFCRNAPCDCGDICRRGSMHEQDGPARRDPAGAGLPNVALKLRPRRAAARFRQTRRHCPAYQAGHALRWIGEFHGPSGSGLLRRAMLAAARGSARRSPRSRWMRGRRGAGLVVYDCYRPQRATRAFIAWAADPFDQAMKGAYYPQSRQAGAVRAWLYCAQIRRIRPA